MADVECTLAGHWQNRAAKATFRSHMSAQPQPIRPTNMLTAFELAGFIAAHAVWCISDADGLVPMVAFQTDDGQRKFERLVFDDVGEAVEHGRKQLESDPFNANDGVLAYDGRIATPEGKRLTRSFWKRVPTLSVGKGGHCGGIHTEEQRRLPCTQAQTDLVGQV